VEEELLKRLLFSKEVGEHKSLCRLSSCRVHHQFRQYYALLSALSRELLNEIRSSQSLFFSFRDHFRDVSDLSLDHAPSEASAP
jgi:hypothetical protein